MLILIGSAALFAILFYFIVRPKNKQKTDANYQKAVKQSQELQKAKQNAASKKKNSSFKVIEGGKK
ncbi:hypothetical protein [Listeria floridensis]|nr:hypothetical protein [Listeria floridensis]